MENDYFITDDKKFIQQYLDIQTEIFCVYVFPYNEETKVWALSEKCIKRD